LAQNILKTIPGKNISQADISRYNDANPAPQTPARTRRRAAQPDGSDLRSLLKGISHEAMA
jgi:hypothetical protein